MHTLYAYIHKYDPVVWVWRKGGRKEMDGMTTRGGAWPDIPRVSPETTSNLCCSSKKTGSDRGSGTIAFMVADSLPALAHGGRRRAHESEGGTWDANAISYSSVNLDSGGGFFFRAGVMF